MRKVTQGVAVHILERIGTRAEITNERVKELIEEVRDFDSEHIAIRWRSPDEVIKFIEG